MPIKQRRLSLIALSLSALLITSVTIAESPKPEKPATRPTTQAFLRFESAKVVRQAYLALKAGDLSAAKSLIADMPTPLRDLDKRLARLNKTYADEHLDFSVLDVKETGDIAVVIVGQFQTDGAKTFESQEWYLLRQNSHWKLLGDFNDFELSNYGFDKPRLDRYHELESWSEKRSTQLRKELTGCEC
jgi:hypothetical protein